MFLLEILILLVSISIQDCSTLSSSDVRICKKYDGKSYVYTHLKVYGVAMAQYGDEDKLLVQAFPWSLIGATLAWFTEIEITKIKHWTDLAHLFIKQYKFNSEIALDREQLQLMSKKSS